MKINREELAWAAGVFDGEGTATAVWQKDRKLWTHPRISVAQNGVELLERFMAAVGSLGHIYLAKTRICNSWQTGKFEHAQAVIALLWPWLTEVKKLQIEKVFHYTEEKRLYKKSQYTRMWKTRRRLYSPVIEGTVTC